ncbi:MAG: sigma-70 family RNA polymerase sigma factor [Oscillospiraceae bacterium]|nr:sigma-70 family RNA polymerase sigma factor [Oscillospiraceae bacterium]
MSRNKKIQYSNIVDEKFSFDFYSGSFGGNNSGNIKNQCKILRLIIEEQLTDKQKQILNMYYSCNLNIPQISEKIGKNKSTVSRSLKRSRETIRDYMKYNSFRQ